MAAKVDAVISGYTFSSFKFDFIGWIARAVTELGAFIYSDVSGNYDNFQIIPHSATVMGLFDNVFSVSATSLIDAPRAKVWSIMMDFPAYVEWNAFVRSQVLTDASKNALPDQTPAVGKYVSIGCHLPPTMGEAGLFGKGSAFVVITHLEAGPDNYRASWRTALALPKFLLHSERWQILTIDEATGKTKYETFEVFNGIVAYIVNFVVGRKLKLGFQAFADCLKQRAEHT